jgi:hypothetical protein
LEGYFLKRRSIDSNFWIRCWIALKSNKLFIYENEFSTNHQNYIPLYAIREVDLCSEVERALKETMQNSKAANCGFQLQTTSGVVQLCARNPQERNYWIGTLRRWKSFFTTQSSKSKRMSFLNPEKDKNFPILIEAEDFEMFFGVDDIIPMENSPPSPISPSAIDAEYEEFYADYT